MGKLVEEVKEWNTPVIGAYLLWHFTQGYVQNHPNGDAPVVVLYFNRDEDAGAYNDRLSFRDLTHLVF